MKKNKLQFDIADEIFDKFQENTYLSRKEVNAKYCRLIETTIKTSDNPYNKEKGLYTSIQFEDLNEENVYQEVKNYMIKYVSNFIESLTSKKKPSILIVGIGNEEYSPDALGPKVVKKMFPTSHLDEKNYKSKVSCIIPGVMGVTGLESFTIVKGIVNENDFDVIIVIDALTTHSITRLNHVIQITDTGLVPGSGVNNARKAFTKENFNVPLISIWIATVIPLNSIYQEVLNSLRINKEIKLNNEQNLILTIKEIESRIELLTTLIADSLNNVFNP